MNRKERYMVFFEPEVLRAVEQIAAQEEHTPSVIVNRICREYLKTHGYLPKE